jgi:hypothetical protein
LYRSDRQHFLQSRNYLPRRQTYRLLLHAFGTIDCTRHQPVPKPTYDTLYMNSILCSPSNICPETNKMSFPGQIYELELFFITLARAAISNKFVVAKCIRGTFKATEVKLATCQSFAILPPPPPTSLLSSLSSVSFAGLACVSPDKWAVGQAGRQAEEEEVAFTSVCKIADGQLSQQSLSSCVRPSVLPSVPSATSSTTWVRVLPCERVYFYVLCRMGVHRFGLLVYRNNLATTSHLLVLWQTC